MLFDYETLKVIWWVLVGVLLIGFALTDGFDMGVGTLLPFLTKKDNERRVLINTIAPHWDGNQVWFLTAGGAIFAAWPLVYSTAFSGLYLAMMTVLAALFLRPVGFDYRSKLENKNWRKRWDIAICIGSFVPPVIFGVAFANLLLGLPFSYDNLMRSTYHGSFFALLNPFALVTGILSISLFVLHGSTYLCLKTEKHLQDRAKNVASMLGVCASVLFALLGIYLYFFIDGYQITSVVAGDAIADPTKKTAQIVAKGWFANYANFPVLLIAPLLGIICPLLVSYFVKKAKYALAFVSSGFSLIGVILTASISLFPFVMPSSFKPDHSLTIWDATSSALTLNTMLIAVLIFVPLVLGYTAWSYIKMAGKVKVSDIEKNSKTLY